MLGTFYVCWTSGGYVNWNKRENTTSFTTMAEIKKIDITKC